MADISALLANAGQTNADFDLGKINRSYWEGRNQAFQQEGRDLFKGGLPTGPDGQPDWGAISKALIQHGDIGQGVATANVDLNRQGLQQQRDDAVTIATGQAPQRAAIVSPPSANRTASAVVAPPLNRGGVQEGSSPQGDQPGSIVGIVSAAGIPDELAGPIHGQLAAMTRTDPNATLDPTTAQRVQQTVQAYAQRMKAGQQGAPQGQPQPQAQPVAQMVPQSPQAAPQPASQPSPFANAVAQGLIPPGVDPNMYVARLNYIAAASQKPEAAKAAKDRVDAITKASELTTEQRDFSAARANPGLNDFTAQREADKARAKGVAESDIKEQDGIIGQGKQASSRLTTLNTMSNIIRSDPNINLGFGGPTALKVKMAMESLGLPVPDLSGPQAIQKLNASLASEMAKSLTSRTTQFEFRTFLGNNPGLELDKSGNERLIGIFSQLAKREVDLGRLARQNRDNWGNWDQVVENYDKQNPMRDPVTKRVLSTDTVIAPGSGKGGTQAGSAQAAAPPVPGARQAPDKNWYVPDPNRPGKYLKVVQ